MIIARRCPTTCNKLQLNIRTMTATATMAFDWNEVFSAENKVRTIEYARLDRESCQYMFPKDDSKFKKAAVLVPLCYDLLGRPSLLYNLRSLNLSRHRGEISFPGGAMDPEDNGDPIITALRETEEELGLKRAKVEVWAILRDFPTVSTRMGVTPVLGFVHGWTQVDPTKMKINPGEVDHAFTVTLEHLCDPINWEDSPKQGSFNFSMPIYKNLNVHSETEVVDLWGLTAFVTHLTLVALLPHVYKRKISFLKPLKPLRNEPNGNNSKL